MIQVTLKFWDVRGSIKGSRKEWGWVSCLLLTGCMALWLQLLISGHSCQPLMVPHKHSFRYVLRSPRHFTDQDVEVHPVLVTCLIRSDSE